MIHLVHLDMSYVHAVNGDTLKQIGRYLSKLEHLNVDGCGQLCNKDVYHLIPHKGKRIGCPLMKHISLLYGCHIGFNGVITLLNRLKNLECLHHQSMLFALSYLSQKHDRKPTVCPKIKKIYHSVLPSDVPGGDDYLEEGMLVLIGVQELKKNRYITQQITEAEITFHPMLRQSLFCSLLTRLKNLSELSLTGVIDFHNSVAVVLDNCGQQLEILSLHDIQQVSLKHIVTCCKKLKSLDIQCRNEEQDGTSENKMRYGSLKKKALITMACLEVLQVSDFDQKHLHPYWLTGMLASPKLKTVEFACTSVITDHIMNNALDWSHMKSVESFCVEICDHITVEPIERLIYENNAALKDVEVQECERITHTELLQVEKYMKRNNIYVETTFQGPYDYDSDDDDDDDDYGDDGDDEESSRSDEYQDALEGKTDENQNDVLYKHGLNLKSVAT